METVVLKTFDNYFSANIVLTRLQDEGINCYLKDEYTVTIDPIISNAIGGIKLAVDTEQAEEASLLLKSYHEDHIRAATCPQCTREGMIEIPLPSPKNVVTSVLTWLFSNYAIPVEYTYECRHCGYRTKVLPESTALSFENN